MRILTQMVLMFLIAAFGWLIFRSTSLDQILYMMNHLGWQMSAYSHDFGYRLLFFTWPLLLVTAFQYSSRNLLALQNLNAWLRIPIYGFMIVWIFVFGVRQSMEFIYFQF